MMKRRLLISVAAVCIASCAPTIRYVGEIALDDGRSHERIEPDYARSSRKLFVRVRDGVAEVEAATIGPAIFLQVTSVRQRYETPHGPWEPIAERIISQRYEERATIPASGAEVTIYDEHGNVWRAITDAEGRALIPLTGATSSKAFQARATIGGADVRSDARLR